MKLQNKTISEDFKYLLRNIFVFILHRGVQLGVCILQNIDHCFTHLDQWDIPSSFIQ